MDLQPASPKTENRKSKEDLASILLKMFGVIGSVILCISMMTCLAIAGFLHFATPGQRISSIGFPDEKERSENNATATAFAQYPIQSLYEFNTIDGDWSIGEFSAPDASGRQIIENGKYRIELNSEGEVLKTYAPKM
jgi:hypothetical protein